MIYNICLSIVALWIDKDIHFLSKKGTYNFGPKLSSTQTSHPDNWLFDLLNTMLLESEYYTCRQGHSERRIGFKTKQFEQKIPEVGSELKIEFDPKYRQIQILIPTNSTRLPQDCHKI